MRFYESIGFSAGPPVAMTPADMALLEMEGRGTRIALRAGSQRIDLESFDQKGGRPYPENATAADLCFQHFALVDSGCGGSMGARPRAWRDPDLHRGTGDAPASAEA